MQLVRTLALVPLMLCVARPAQADWERRSGGSGNRILVGVSAPDAQTLYAVGFHFDTSGMLPAPTPHAFVSSDGGLTLSEVTNNLGNGEMFWIPESVFFVDAQNGWVTGGNLIYRTTDGGADWQRFDAGVAIDAVHFFDAQTGIALGESGTFKITSNGGAAWTDAPGPATTVHLRRTFWLDNQRGWIVGYDERQEEDPFDGSMTTFHENGTVFSTVDGGSHWSASNVIDGRGLAGIFFLPDGQTGFVSGWQWIDEDRNDAHLYRTTDGGLTFADMDVPKQVGTLEFAGLGGGPIHTSAFTAIYWSDAQHGHLGGTAFIMKLSSSGGGGGGGSSRVFRTVDYLTEDGGATWSRTDLGTITVEIGPTTTPPENDGVLLDGVMSSFYDGVMVGEMKSVWRYEWLCGSVADCPPGYDCDATSACVPPVDDGSCTPACGPGQHCESGNCVADTGTTGGTTPTGTAQGVDPEGGCSCRSGRGMANLVWVILGLLGIRWRRRRGLAVC